jgi:hypothetical protein
MMALNKDRRGQLVEAKADGVGVLTPGRFEDTCFRVYDGFWAGGRKNGFGRAVFRDGREYVGMWIRDSMAHFGQMRWPDGSSFSGAFEQDEPDGWGLIELNGTGLYVQECMKDGFPVPVRVASKAVMVGLITLCSLFVVPHLIELLFGGLTGLSDSADELAQSQWMTHNHLVSHLGRPHDPEWKELSRRLQQALAPISRLRIAAKHAWEEEDEEQNAYEGWGNCPGLGWMVNTPLPRWNYISQMNNPWLRLAMRAASVVAGSSVRWGDAGLRGSGAPRSELIGTLVRSVAKPCECYLQGPRLDLIRSITAIIGSAAMVEAAYLTGRSPLTPWRRDEPVMEQIELLAGFGNASLGNAHVWNVSKRSNQRGSLPDLEQLEQSWGRVCQCESASSTSFEEWFARARESLDYIRLASDAIQDQTSDALFRRIRKLLQRPLQLVFPWSCLHLWASHEQIAEGAMISTVGLKRVNLLGAAMTGTNGWFFRGSTNGNGVPVEDSLEQAVGQTGILAQALIRKLLLERVNGSAKLGEYVDPVPLPQALGVNVSEPRNATTAEYLLAMLQVYARIHLRRQIHYLRVGMMILFVMTGDLEEAIASVVWGSGAMLRSCSTLIHVLVSVAALCLPRHTPLKPPPDNTEEELPAVPAPDYSMVNQAIVLTRQHKKRLEAFGFVFDPSGSLQPSAVQQNTAEHCVYLLTIVVGLLSATAVGLVVCVGVPELCSEIVRVGILHKIELGPITGEGMQRLLEASLQRSG